MRTVAALLLCGVLAAGCSAGDATDATTAPEPSSPATPPSLPVESGAPDPRPSSPNPAVDDGACRDEPTGPEEFAYATWPGTSPNLTSLDVYLPAGCGPVPAVVWVHGGGWRRGDKALGSVDGKVRLANELGFALVAVNYRLSAEGAGVLWPDHGDDVAAALAWLRTEGPDLGIDPNRLALLGHSAGAHLVAVAGTDPDLLTRNGADPAAVRCVVVLDSASYTLSADNPLHANAFGTDPEVLAGASPLTLVERNGAPGAEFLVVAQGRALRLATQRTLADAITAGDGTANFVDANPYDHIGVSAAVGDPTDTIVTPAIRDLLVPCLAP